MPDSPHAPIISPALQDWLAHCESLVEMHNNFVADGGHMQFNLDLLDPEKITRTSALRGDCILRASG